MLFSVLWGALMADAGNNHVPHLRTSREKTRSEWGSHRSYYTSPLSTHLPSYYSKGMSLIPARQRWTISCIYFWNLKRLHWGVRSHGCISVVEPPLDSSYHIEWYCLGHQLINHNPLRMDDVTPFWGESYIGLPVQLSCQRCWTPQV